MIERIQKIKFKTKIELINELQFNVKFDLPDSNQLLMDETSDFGGKGLGPNASRLIAAGVGNCLCASLLFCIRKSRVDLIDVRAEIEGTLKRNVKGRFRIDKIDVKIFPKMKNKKDLEKLKRCENIFEDYCIVTESVRKGIEVNTNVIPEFALE